MFQGWNKVKRERGSRAHSNRRVTGAPVARRRRLEDVVRGKSKSAALGTWDKGGLLRKPIRASRQSVVPRAAACCSCCYCLHRTWICRAETLKSHQICRAALSLPPYRRMRDPLVDIRAGKKVVYPPSRFTLLHHHHHHLLLLLCLQSLLGIFSLHERFADTRASWNSV